MSRRQLWSSVAALVGAVLSAVLVVAHVGFEALSWWAVVLSWCLLTTLTVVVAAVALAGAWLLRPGGDGLLLVAIAGGASCLAGFSQLGQGAEAFVATLLFWWPAGPVAITALVRWRRSGGRLGDGGFGSGPDPGGL
ncbi:hypothetical protein AB0M47_11475 [Hamadaea sp. NPDC051192]|uniref:hypothetical protein n=1 Tax=Hamadaea sp. NPDC051192 TaxID=3154940 RepID=UPI0034427729